MQTNPFWRVFSPLAKTQTNPFRRAKKETSYVYEDNQGFCLIEKYVVLCYHQFDQDEFGDGFHTSLQFQQRNPKFTFRNGELVVYFC